MLGQTASTHIGIKALIGLLSPKLQQRSIHFLTNDAPSLDLPRCTDAKSDPSFAISRRHLKTAAPPPRPINMAVAQSQSA